MVSRAGWEVAARASSCTLPMPSSCTRLQVCRADAAPTAPSPLPRPASGVFARSAPTPVRDGGNPSSSAQEVAFNSTDAGTVLTDDVRQWTTEDGKAAAQGIGGWVGQSALVYSEKSSESRLHLAHRLRLCELAVEVAPPAMCSSDGPCSSRTLVSSCVCTCALPPFGFVALASSICLPQVTLFVRNPSVQLRRILQKAKSKQFHQTPFRASSGNSSDS